MRNHIYLLFIFVLGSQLLFAQCQPFAVISKQKLDDYIHDGTLNTIPMSVGKIIQTQKTFYSGQNYRIVVVAEETIAEVEFTVMDMNKNILFTNKEKTRDKTWDFSIESTRTLLINITIPRSQANETAKGCVALLFGFKSTENLVKKYEKTE